MAALSNARFGRVDGVEETRRHDAGGKIETVCSNRDQSRDLQSHRVVDDDGLGILLSTLLIEGGQIVSYR